jgi:hypothetical protein
MVDATGRLTISPPDALVLKIDPHTLGRLRELV